MGALLPSVDPVRAVAERHPLTEPGNDGRMFHVRGGGGSRRFARFEPTNSSPCPQ